MRKPVLVVLFITLIFNLNGSNGIPVKNIFFLKLVPEKGLIELGDYDPAHTYRITDSVYLNDAPAQQLQAFENYFTKRVPDNASALFFIHAMWASNKTFAKSQAADFYKTYVSDISCPVKYVFYIIWDTGSPFYSSNKMRCDLASASLNDLFMLLSGINKENKYHFDLMCHSMGNEMFYHLLATEPMNEKVFDHIICAAPDVDRDYLDDKEVTDNIKILTGDLSILYNENDRALMASMLINNYIPLGLFPDPDTPEINPFIHLYNCTHISDNTQFPSSMTGHLYYSTSSQTKDIIKSILK